MATTIKTKQHDTKIIFTDTPTINDVIQTFASFSGSTCKFLMKDKAGVAASVSQSATISNDGSGNAVFTYQPTATDVQNTGTFQQEWEVTYPGAKILTFPNDTYNIVKILADLG